MEQPSRQETRLAQFRILEAQRAMEEAVRFLRRMKDREVELDSLQDFVMAFWPSTSEKDSVLVHLQRMRMVGERPTKEDLGAIEYLSRKLIPLKFESMDSLTSIASTRVVREDGGMESWFLYASDILIANFGKGEERAFAYCVGRPSSGKTNVAILAIQAALDKGWDVVTNIHIHGQFPRGFHYENRLSGLLRQAATLRVQDVPMLIALDEGGLWWLRSQAQRRESQGLDKVARVIGKLGASTLFIEQRERSIPTTVLSFARSAFYCKTPGRIRIEHRGPVHFYRSLKDVPLARVQYDSQDISYLAYDLNVDALFSHVGSVSEGGLAQAQAMLAYLDGEREVDQEAKKYAVWAMAETGKHSQREMAESVGVSQGTVSNWLKRKRESQGDSD